MARKKYLFGVVLTLMLAGCSADDSQQKGFTPRQLTIQSISYSSWDGETRAAVQRDATSKRIWVSANDAAPSQYAYDNTAGSDTYGKYKVVSGSPQEWNDVTAQVYGFYNSNEANRINTQFSVDVVQDGLQSYDFQASAHKMFTYSSQSSDGVTLALYQQLTKVELVVEDADVNTRVYMGNDQLFCSGMFQYTAPTGNYFQTSEGYWSFTGNRQTMTLSNANTGAPTRFVAFILPQTVATASKFFRVYNTVTGRSAYYALPSNNYKLEEGHVYTCTLRQEMSVVSILVDEDYSNNNGDVIPVDTEASN